MQTCTRRIEFDAGHRVLGHGGKCRHLHGHRYAAEVTCRALCLDSLGMVVDFSVIKDKVGRWVDENWDHNILLHPNDPLAELHARLKQNAHRFPDNDEIEQIAWGVFHGKDPYLMPEGNPTAEYIADHLFHMANTILASDRIEVVHVRVYETPNCWADYARPTMEHL